MSRIEKVAGLLRDNKLYIGLLIFIIGFNLIAHFNKIEQPTSPAERIRNEHLVQIENKFSSSEKIKELFSAQDNIYANMLAAFIIITMLAFVAGVIIDIVLIVIKINKVDIIHKVAFFKRIGWNWQDIIRISILFVFISYLVNIGWVLTDKYLNLTRYSTYSKIATSMTLSYFIMITLLFFFVYIKYKDKIQSLGLQFRSFFKSMFLGLAGYVAIIPVLVAAVFISSGLASYFKLKPEARPILEAFLVQDGQFLLVYLMLIVCFVGPVIEEVFFRGFVYTALRKRLSSFLSITISAFFFSWLHMTLFGFLPILILGILLAYLYEKNGTLIPSIIVHIVHNSAVVIFLLIIRGLVL